MVQSEYNEKSDNDTTSWILPRTSFLTLEIQQVWQNDDICRCGSYDEPISIFALCNCMHSILRHAKIRVLPSGGGVLSDRFDVNKTAREINALINLVPWWRHQMETFSALLAICAGNLPVPGELPAQRPVTRSFNVFFDLRVNKRLSKQS